MEGPLPPSNRGQTNLYNFNMAGTKLGQVVSALGELLNNIWRKAEDKIRVSAVALEKAVGHATQFLSGIRTLPKAQLEELKKLSHALAAPGNSGNSFLLWLTARKLLKTYGDVVEVVLGAAASPGLGLDLKNACYQLSSLVHQDFGSAGKSLKELVQQMGVDGVMKSFDEDLSRLNTAALAAPQDYDVLQKVFLRFSNVIIHVFRKVGNISISEVEIGSEPQVLPVKDYNFQPESKLFGRVVSTLGAVLHAFRRWKDDANQKPDTTAPLKPDTAAALKKAVDDVIKVLAGIGIVPGATLTQFGTLSDELVKAATSGDEVGVGLAALKLLYIYGDVLETVLKGVSSERVVPEVGSTLKDICYQLGSLVHQGFAGAGKAVTAFLQPTDLGETTLQSFNNELLHLNEAAVTVSQAFNQDFNQNLLTSFSPVIIGVFGAVSVPPIVNPPPIKPGPTKVDIKPVAAPFADVLKKVGELLHTMLKTGGRAQIRPDARALDVAVALLRKSANISSGNLDAAASLSDALVREASSTSVDGVSRAISDLLKKLAEITRELFGSGYQSVSLALSSIIDQLANVVDGIVKPLMNASTVLEAGLLLPTLLPLGTVVSRTAGFVTNSLEPEIKPFGLQNATLLSNALYKLRGDINNTEAGNVGLAFQDVFKALASIYHEVITGISSKDGFNSGSSGTGSGTTKVAAPFAEILKKVGELLHTMLRTGGRAQIRPDARALDVAVALLRKSASISSANLDEAARLSDALVREASSTSVDGVSRAISDLLKNLVQITRELFGSAYENVRLALKRIVDDLADVINGIVKPLMNASTVLEAGLLLPTLLPFCTVVSRAAGFVTNSLEPEIKPFGLQNATPLSNALYKLRGAINNTEAEKVGLAFQEVFNELAPIYLRVITGIGSKGGVHT